MQNHAADQLDIEVPHVEHTPTSFANHGESFFEDFIENLLDDAATLGFHFFAAVWIGIRFVSYVLETFLNAGAEFIGLRPELVVGELLDLRLKRVDSRDTGQQALDFALILRPENLA
jgi:hypothetical protein